MTRATRIARPGLSAAATLVDRSPVEELTSVERREPAMGAADQSEPPWRGHRVHLVLITES